MKLELLAVDSFDKCFNLSSQTGLINASSVYVDYNSGGKLLIVDDRLNVLTVHDTDGTFSYEVLTEEIKKIRSFKRLGIKIVNGSGVYRPSMAFVDAAGSRSTERVYVLDDKRVDIAAHTLVSVTPIIEYKTPNWDRDKFVFSDVILTQSKTNLEQIVTSISPFYHYGYGYKTVLYAIDEKKRVLEFGLQSYYSFLSQQLVQAWDDTKYGNKLGFLKLSGEWSSRWIRGERVFAAGILGSDNDKGPVYYLQLVNKGEITRPDGDFVNYGGSIPSKIPLSDKILLRFRDTVNMKKQTPYFDSGAEIGDGEFVAAFIPKVNGQYRTEFRDFYYFRLNKSGSCANVSAKPFRLGGFDRFSKSRNRELSIGLSAEEDEKTKDVYLFFTKRFGRVKKVRFDLKY